MAQRVIKRVECVTSVCVPKDQHFLQIELWTAGLGECAQNANKMLSKYNTFGIGPKKKKVNSKTGKVASSYFLPICAPRTTYRSHFIKHQQGIQNLPPLSVCKIDYLFSTVIIRQIRITE